MWYYKYYTLSGKLQRYDSNAEETLHGGQSARDRPLILQPQVHQPRGIHLSKKYENALLMSAKDIQFFDSKEKRRGEKDTKKLLDLICLNV